MNTFNLEEELNYIERIFEEYPELKERENRLALLSKFLQDGPLLELLNSDLSQLDEFRTLVWHLNKEKIYDYLMNIDIDQEIKDILINFKDDFAIFIPGGGGGNPGDKPKKLTENEKKMYAPFMNLILTSSIIFAQIAPLAIDVQNNLIKNKEIEYTRETKNRSLDLKERELDLNEKKYNQEYELQSFGNFMNENSSGLNQKNLELEITKLKETKEKLDEK